MEHSIAATKVYTCKKERNNICCKLRNNICFTLKPVLHQLRNKNIIMYIYLKRKLLDSSFEGVVRPSTVMGSVFLTGSGDLFVFPWVSIICLNRIYEALLDVVGKGGGQSSESRKCWWTSTSGACTATIWVNVGGN